VADLMKLIELYESQECLPRNGADDTAGRIRQFRERIDLEFLREDAVKLIAESKEGADRVKRIVQDLRDFSRPGEEEWQWVDLRSGLDSTLNVVWNEIKFKADVAREYGDIPQVECLASQLNQVFMNLLLNAAQAIQDFGKITLRTGQAGGGLFVAISDTGQGMEPEIIDRIFDPFFTTKPVGQGTGLGLSVSYGIVQKHGGRIEVQSEPGNGSTFTVWLPLKRPA
jgi:two-component system NtrC family sensor kinase